MKTEEKDGRVYPVVMYNSQNELIGAGLINEKGIRKTTERGALWLLNGASGKLLPETRAQGFRRIRQKQGYVEVIADSYNEASIENNAEQKLHPAKSESEAESRAEPAQENSADSALAATSAESKERVGDILLQLEELIIHRKKHLPADSYTTYLFQQGEEKIRKKLGEEAVELILAQSNEEIISESADMLYQFIVLCVERGIPLARVLNSLYARR